MKAENFFTETEKEEIAKAVQGVEKKTAGEIAVMVVDSSDTYPESLLLAGFLLGNLLALPISHLFFAASLWHYLPLFFLFAIVLMLLLRKWPILLRHFILPVRLEEMVRRRALRAFYEKELYRTRDETGVLFFISLFERRVWILADKGIYQQLSQQDLQHYAAGIARGIKEKDAATRLIQQIEAIGIVLARHFPIKPDDINEIPDNVIIG